MGESRLNSIRKRLSVFLVKQRSLRSAKECAAYTAEKDRIAELSSIEKEHLKKAVMIDRKLYAIQQSTKTTIPQLIRLHNYLRMNLKWYYDWHLWRGAKYVHSLTVLSSIVMMVFLVAKYHQQPIIASNVVVSTASETLVAKDTSSVLKATSGEVEIVEERTENFKKFQEPDGKVRVAGGLGPIHYKLDSDSSTEKFKEINLTIKENVEKSADKNYDWSMDKNGYQVKLWNSQNGINYTAQFQRDGQNISMAPAVLAWENSAGEFQEISKPVSNIAPEIDNNNYTITWKNVFGDGLDFRYNLSPDKFFKTVIVNDKSKLPVATIGAEGLKLTVVMGMAWSDVQTTNGFATANENEVLSNIYDPIAQKIESKDNPAQFSYKDINGQDLWSVQKPLAWDSAEKVNLFNMDWSLEKVETSTFMKLSTKNSDLNKEGVVYPFYMDTAIAEQQVNASANDMGMTGTTYPGSDTNYAVADQGMWAGASYGCIDQDPDTGDCYAYGNTYNSAAARFLPPIPQGVTVNTASLSVASAYGTYSSAATWKIAAEKVDNSGVFNTTTHTPNTVYTNKTTAITSWTLGNWAALTFYPSSDINSVVQEIVNQAGWVSGNGMSLVIYPKDTTENTSLRYFQAYDSLVTPVHSWSPKFNATYTGSVTVPDAPTSAVATRGNASASVAFTAPASDGGATITGYTVTSTPGSFTGTGASSPITVSGLTNGTSYTFTVHATNSAGNSAESSASAAVTPATVPGAPTIGTATAGNASASVAFSAPGSTGGSAITGYTVTSTPGSLTGTGASSPITVSGLTNGTSYTFTVHATNAVGNSSESLASNSVIPATVPGAPTSAVATRGNVSASVAFTAPVSNGGASISGYTVISTPGSFTGTGASSPITVSGLTNGTSYTFTVHATNSIGNSAESSASSAVIPATTPGAPTGATATAGNASASVAFSASGSTGGSAITGYTVTSTPGSITGTGASSPITVSGLTNGTSYTFTIHATNSVGNSAESTASVAVIPVTLPGAPTGVTATRGDLSASIAFTAPVSDGGATITGYTVISTPGSFTGTGVSSPITVSSLVASTAYTFTVHATTSVGNSAESIASNSITAATKPSAPVVNLVTVDNGSVSVAFSSSVSSGGAGITGYTAISSPGGLTGTGSSPITVSGLTNGTAYTFTVHATNAIGNSVESNVSASATPYTTPDAPTTLSAISGNASASVSFSAPAVNGGAPVLEYYVTSSPGGFVGTGLSSPITVSGLTNGTAYTFTVHATNLAGDSPESSASSVATPLGIPSAPTGVLATAGNAEAIVSFAAPSSTGGTSITSYTVSSTPGGLTATGTVSPITIYGLTNGTAYTFTVYATNIAGNSPSSTASASITPTAPAVASTPVTTTPVSVPAAVDSELPVIKMLIPTSTGLDQQITVDATGSTDNVGIVSYEWNFGDNVLASGIQATHKYAEPGARVVSLVVLDKAGNKASKSQKIIVLPPVPQMSEINSNGKVLTLKGTAFPLSWVTITIHSDPYSVETQANKDGVWQVSIDIEKNNISEGKHQIVLASSIGSLAKAEAGASSGSVQTPVESDTKTYNVKISDNSAELNTEVAKLRMNDLNLKSILIIGGAIILVLIAIIFWKVNRAKNRP